MEDCDDKFLLVPCSSMIVDDSLVATHKDVVFTFRKKELEISIKGYQELYLFRYSKLKMEIKPESALVTSDGLKMILPVSSLYRRNIDTLMEYIDRRKSSCLKRGRSSLDPVNTLNSSRAKEGFEKLLLSASKLPKSTSQNNGNKNLGIENSNRSSVSVSDTSRPIKYERTQLEIEYVTGNRQKDNHKNNNNKILNKNILTDRPPLTSLPMTKQIITGKISTPNSIKKWVSSGF